MHFFKLSSLLTVTLILAGCPIDGDKGQTGAAGTTGTTGISCWDLNEDGIKTMPDEDTNLDGMVSVLDCRAAQSTVAAGSVVANPTTGLVVHEHTRESYATFGLGPNRLPTYTGTTQNYLDAIASMDYLSLDVYLTDLSSADPCGLWDWHEQPSGAWLLTANDVINVSTLHLPIQAIDSAGGFHYGSESCALSCLSDSQCVAATYSPVNGVNQNTMICKLGYKVGIDLASGSEMIAINTSARGLSVAGMEAETGINQGIISVCNAP